MHTDLFHPFKSQQKIKQKMNPINGLDSARPHMYIFCDRSTFHKYYRVLIQGFESASIQSYLMLMRRRSVSYNVRVNTCIDICVWTITHTYNLCTTIDISMSSATFVRHSADQQYSLEEQSVWCRSGSGVKRSIDREERRAQHSHLITQLIRLNTDTLLDTSSTYYKVS